MDILMASAEMVPLAKTGGLGDVAGALPQALAKAGHRVRVMLPAYRDLALPAGASPRPCSDVPEAEFAFGGRSLKVGYGTFESGKVGVVLADIPEYFGNRPGIYVRPEDRRPWPDGPERFIAFSRAVAAYVQGRRKKPDVVHLHDNHPALAAPLLVEGCACGCQRPRVVLTIHNLAFQGVSEPETYGLTGLPHELFAPMGPCEYYGKLNAMKAGIVFSDAVTTVSPTYAREILTREFGCGMEGLLKYYEGKLSGILNGIDTGVWNPKSDPHIAARYGAGDGAGAVLEAKRRNRLALQKEMGLSEQDAPLIAIVGRLSSQKGMDLVVRAAPFLVRKGFQLALLGTGEPDIEAELKTLASLFPRQVAARFSFDEALAHRMQAGATFLLVPSRFEPCGLTQLYAQAYGTVPIVRRTGGLADTVQDVGEFPKEGTGLVFDRAEPQDLEACLARAWDLLGDHAAFQEAVLRGMKRDFSWEHAAKDYLRLYEKLGCGKRSAAHGGCHGA